MYNSKLYVSTTIKLKASINAMCHYADQHIYNMIDINLTV